MSDIERVVYSNSNHTFDPSVEKVEADLRAGFTRHHAAWNFWGTFTFSNGQFHEEVKQHHHTVKVVSDPSLVELVRRVNDEFGSE